MANTSRATLLTFFALILGFIAIGIGSAALIYSLVWTTEQTEPAFARDFTVQGVLTVNEVQCNGTFPLDCLPLLEGDVTGAPGNNLVVQLQNHTLSADTPTDGQLLVWDTGLPGWKPNGNPVYYGDGTQGNSGTDGVTLGANASTAGATQAVALGAGATANAISNAVSLGAGASPLDAAHGLALAVPAASATPATIGLTINGAARIFRTHTSLYTEHNGGVGRVMLTATSSEVHLWTVAQDAQLPDATTLERGFMFRFINLSSGTVNVYNAVGGLQSFLNAQTYVNFMCWNTTDAGGYWTRMS